MLNEEIPTRKFWLLLESGLFYFSGCSLTLSLILKRFYYLRSIISHVNRSECINILHFRVVIVILLLLLMLTATTTRSKSIVHFRWAHWHPHTDILVNVVTISILWLLRLMLAICINWCRWLILLLLLYVYVLRQFPGYTTVIGLYQGWCLIHLLYHPMHLVLGWQIVASFFNLQYFCVHFPIVSVLHRWCVITVVKLMKLVGVWVGSCCWLSRCRHFIYVVLLVVYEIIISWQFLLINIIHLLLLPLPILIAELLWLISACCLWKL